MIKSDYLLGMIGAMSEAIGQIIFNRERGRHREAEEIAKEEYMTLMGMPLDMILSLPAESLLDFLTTYGDLDPRKALMLVDLLTEDANTREDADETELAQAIFQKCEALLNALDRYEWDDDDVLAAIDQRMAAFGID